MLASCTCTHLVFKHFFVDAEVRVRVEVVVLAARREACWGGGGGTTGRRMRCQVRPRDEKYHQNPSSLPTFVVRRETSLVVKEKMINRTSSRRPTQTTVSVCAQRYLLLLKSEDRGYTCTFRAPTYDIALCRLGHI